MNTTFLTLCDFFLLVFIYAFNILCLFVLYERYTDVADCLLFLDVLDIFTETLSLYILDFFIRYIYECPVAEDGYYFYFDFDIFVESL